MRITVYCQFQDFVIIRIATDADSSYDRDHTDKANQQSKKLLSLFYTDVRVEFRAGQDIRQFAHRCFGTENICSIYRFADRLCRNGIGR